LKGPAGAWALSRIEAFKYLLGIAKFILTGMVFVPMEVE